MRKIRSILTLIAHFVFFSFGKKNLIVYLFKWEKLWKENPNYPRLP